MGLNLSSLLFHCSKHFSCSSSAMPDCAFVVFFFASFTSGKLFLFMSLFIWLNEKKSHRKLRVNRGVGPRGPKTALRGGYVNRGVVVVEEPVSRLPEIRHFPPQTVAQSFQNFQLDFHNFLDGSSSIFQDDFPNFSVGSAVEGRPERDWSSIDVSYFFKQENTQTLGVFQ